MITPDMMPVTQEQIARHRNSPSLVREYVKNLPDGFSLFYFCCVVMGYDDLSAAIHGPLCYFLEHEKYGRYRDALVPRSWFKTSIATIGKSIWLPIRRNTNIRILIAMNTADNAEKRVHVIRRHWESNELLKSAFPELVPDYRQVRWSNSCAELKRPRRSEEGTYEAIGSGGAVVSRHYDHIDEDDLVYAKKDDMSGAEVQPNQEDINKAVGWHKLVYSLFSDPNKATLDNIGTRWGVHDMKDWIWNHERNKFKFFRLSVEKQDSSGNFTGEPIWPERFGRDTLDDILSSQGATMYAMQYLNAPRDSKDALFNTQALQYYYDDSQIPSNCTYATIVDLAGWGDSKGLAKNVIITIARDAKNHLWVRRYDRGKFNPTEVIALMESHARVYGSQPDRYSCWVEEVQYQKAIRHFARKHMEESGFIYTLNGLKSDVRKDAKDLRIKTLQPVVQQGFLHIKPMMKELVNEMTDYPNGFTCDIIDCLGYCSQRRLPSVPDSPLTIQTASPFSLDSILDSLPKTTNLRYPFSLQCERVIDG